MKPLISYSCARLNTQNQTASAVPKESPPPSPVRSSCALVIASDMHLEPGGGRGGGRATQVKNVDFHTAKNAPKQATPFLFFIFLYFVSRVFM